MASAALWAVLASVSSWAAPSMLLEAQRPRIYEGETATFTVTVSGDEDAKGVPDFPDFKGGAIEHFDTRSSSSQSISIINGRMTKNVSISAATNIVLVDSPFTVTLTISIRALDKPNAAVEPIYPSRPLHVSAEYLDGGDRKGIKLPSANDLLAPLLAKDPSSTPGFTVNGFSRRATPSMGGFFSMAPFSDPFAETPCVFRFPPKQVERNGTNYWDYSVSMECRPEAEGSYTFGPASIKGSIVIGLKPDGTPRFDPVYLIGPALTVHVVPPPEEGRPDFFIGAVGKGMKATATLDTDRCKVGDPLTLTLDLAGEISLGNLRPPVLSLQPNASPDFRIYDDNVESSRLPDGRRFKYRVRPLRSGTLEFPAISVAYFDTARNAYATVTVPAMPVQVEATTQVAAVSSGDPAGSASSVGLLGAGISPDGIMVSSRDEQPLSLARGIRGLIALLTVPPLLWISLLGLSGLLRIFRRHSARRNPKRMAANAFADFRTATRRLREDPSQAAIDAARAVRAYVAAFCRSKSVSLTADEMEPLLRGAGVDGASARRFRETFARLEQIPYGGGTIPAEAVGKILDALEVQIRDLSSRSSAGGKARSRLPLLLLLLLLPGLSLAIGRPPDSFEWERANDAMSSARTPDDFERAARLYYGQVTNGASTGPLYYNLGTALLLARRPGDACKAFDYSERTLGTFGAIARNRDLATVDHEKAYSYAPARRFPVSRVFLCWHYGVPWAMRIDLAVGAWIVFWLALVVRFLFTAAPAPGTSPGILRVFTNFLAVLGLALALLFAISSTVTLLQERHDPLSLAGLAETAEAAAAPAEDLP